MTTIPAPGQGTEMLDELVPLRLEHAYPRANPSSIYWSLSPFAIQQMTVSSCGLATMTMILNATRAASGALSMGTISTEESVLNLLNDEKLRTGTAPGGGGMSLVDFARWLGRALDIHGIAREWRVTAKKVDDPATAGDAFREALRRMEATGAFVAANFHLDKLYEDGIDVGHFSPIGAYHEACDRALILDVYKPDYEPMWVPVARLLGAMATVSDFSGEYRGYAVIER